MEEIHRVTTSALNRSRKLHSDCKHPRTASGKKGRAELKDDKREPQRRFDGSEEGKRALFHEVCSTGIDFFGGSSKRDRLMHCQELKEVERGPPLIFDTTKVVTRQKVSNKASRQQAH